MSSNSKMVVGVFSFVPILLLIVFIPVFINLIPEFIEWDKHEPDVYEVFRTLGPVLIIGIFGGLISLGLLVFFVIHVVNNKNLESNEKIIWIFVFFFASIVGYPIYWWLRIWNEKPVSE